MLTRPIFVAGVGFDGAERIERGHQLGQVSCRLESGERAAKCTARAVGITGLHVGHAEVVAQVLMQWVVRVTCDGVACRSEEGKSLARFVEREVEEPNVVEVNRHGRLELQLLADLEGAAGEHEGLLRIA